MTSEAKLKRMVGDMLKTLLDLSEDPMARVDARAFHAHYLRRAKRLFRSIDPERPLPDDNQIHYTWYNP